MNTSSTVMKDIRFDPEIADFLKAVQVPPDGGLGEAAGAFFEWAGSRIQPKALYELVFIEERDGDSVVFDGVRFRSAVLAENLKDVERVFAFVTTCGNELEGISYEPDPFMGPFWLDALKALALNAATSALRDELGRRYGLEGYATMNPGAADVDVWPIEQQRLLFSLFGDVKELIGVSLTDSYLMLPTKTVSGIFFETDASFINCQLCTREVCPSRRAKYSGTVR